MDDYGTEESHGTTLIASANVSIEAEALVSPAGNSQHWFRDQFLTTSRTKLLPPVGTS